MDVPLRARKRQGRCSVCNVECSTKGGWGMCKTHYRAARYSAIKDAAIAVMGGACERCGGVFPRAVFDFHHHGAKSGDPSSMLVNRSAAAIADELGKCSLLCANCHRMEHGDDDVRRSVREADRT